MSQLQLSSSAVNKSNGLLDAILTKNKIKNDAALARALETSPAVISKIRNYQMPVGPTMLLRMHDLTGYTIQELRHFMQAGSVSAAEAAPRDDSVASMREKLRRVIEKAQERGGSCLSREYVHSNQLMEFYCKDHGAFSARPRKILAGSWCAQCAHEKDRQEMRFRLRLYVAEHGGKLKSPYVNMRTHVTVECLTHGEWQVTPANMLLHHSWCPSCARAKPRPGRSKKS